MKKFAVVFCLLLLLGFAPGAYADDIQLWDLYFRLDSPLYGQVLYSGFVPFPDASATPGFDALFQPGSGMGSVTWTIGAGTTLAQEHTLIALLDLNIFQQPGGNDFDNEYGVQHGTAVGTSNAEQSWEIDMYGPASVPGDILYNVTFFDFFEFKYPGELDNSNNAPIETASQFEPFAHDVAMALGWKFTPEDDGGGLNANDITITFNTALIGDSSRIKFWSTYADGGAAIGGGPGDLYLEQADLPEPGTWMLLGIGLALLSTRRLVKRLR